MYRRKQTRGRLRVVVPAVALCLVAVTASACGDGPTAAAAGRAFVVGSTTAPTTASTSTTSTSTTVPTTTSSAPTTTPPTTAPPAPAPRPTVTAAPVTTVATGAYCLGDSVMIAAGPALFDVLSMCGVVDAVESRQVRNAGPAASVAASSGAPAVVVHLGTNGPVTAAQVDGVLAPLSGVPRVVLVTIQTSGTRAHQGPVNAELRAAASRWRNVRVADFEAATSGQPALFASDGIHLGRAGAQVYAQVIAGAMS